ncbi:MAG: IclR family transcriptional regulator [Acidobacteriia bacterium]|nr:IclR family transcriptional regulator [Terriglobia bacterium]
MALASLRRRVPVARRRESASGASKSLQKAIRILLHMGQNGPELRISEIAASLRLNKTTVYRLLGAMEKFDLIQRDPEGEKYRLGLKLHDLGTKALKARTLQSEARRFLADLARVSNEAVSLAVPGSSGVVCVERFDSPGARITVRTPVGSLFPAHCTAAGKAVLAYLSEQDVSEIVQRNGMQRYTAGTHARIEELKNDLRRVRQRGYALDEQELERGLNGVAAPIILQDAHVVGAVGISGPTQRFQGRELGEKIDLVRETARKIAANLGDHTDWPGVH